jgi:hypothetical protein
MLRSLSAHLVQAGPDEVSRQARSRVAPSAKVRGRHRKETKRGPEVAHQPSGALQRERLNVAPQFARRVVPQTVAGDGG